MNINELNPIFESGLANKMLSAGLLSPKVILYRDYVLFVEKEMVVNGRNKNQAVKATANFYDIYERDIWRALKVFKN